MTEQTKNPTQHQAPHQANKPHEKPTEKPAMATAGHGHTEAKPNAHRESNSGSHPAKESMAGIDGAAEASYWMTNHASRPFAVVTYTYEEFAPAYQYGWESFGRPHYQGKTFESIEADLGRGWEKAKGTSKLGWDHAKAATHEAWDRVKNAASALVGESQASCTTKDGASGCASLEPTTATNHA